MSVKVVFPPYVRRFTGGQEWVESTGQNVGECLDNLEIKFPGIKQQLCNEQGRLFSFYVIYVKSESLYTDELAKQVEDGEELTIVPVIAGG